MRNPQGRRSNLRKSSRAAFTLVELLVVITIIGMLMAMIFPALGSFMARLDQVKCENNQKEIATAIGRYVNTKSRYPGYSTRVMMSTGDSSGKSSGSRQAALKSWTVAVLEMIDKEKYDAIRRDLPSKPVELKMFRCPAASRTEDQINYVANCGRKDAAGASGNIPPDWKSNGVFMQELLQYTSGMRQEIVRSTDIADGEANTLLISENLQAQKWTLHEEPDIGMIWDATSPEGPEKDSMRINVQREDQVNKGNYDYARPSSNHPEGVVVAFCDSRAFFLSDRVDYAAVYCKLMTPNGAEAKEPGQNKRSHDFFRQPFDEKLMNP